jgi:hypothetical protein
VGSIGAVDVVIVSISRGKRIVGMVAAAEDSFAGYILESCGPVPHDR